MAGIAVGNDIWNDLRKFLPGYQLSWSKVGMDFQIIVEAFVSLIF
jgi:hypothetical protein